MNDHDGLIEERTEARAEAFRAQERVRELERKIQYWYTCDEMTKAIEIALEVAKIRDRREGK